MLYLVATPIGNLEDMTYRAVRILGEVSLIAAEDTRHTRKLLNHYDIRTPLISFHEHSRPEAVDDLIARCAAEDVALVSDAGTPLISDPGYRLVQAAVAGGVEVVPIPGPSAAVTALIASGLPTDRFLYLGFPPKQMTKRQQLFTDIKEERGSLIFYESPKRLVSFLEDGLEVWGERQVAVGRELTKRFEEIWRGPLTAALSHFKTADIRGEITVVVAGKTEQDEIWGDDAVLQALNRMVTEGSTRKTAVEEVTQLSGRRKKEVYQLSLTLAE